VAETFTGQGVPRKEDPRLLTGAGSYVSDLHAPDMLSAVVVRSPHAHARIASLDVSRAASVPGVAAVFSHADLGAAQMPIPSFGQFPQSLLDQWKPEIRPAPAYPFAADKVRYVGEPIALVIARDRYVAEDAAEQIDVLYEPLPAVVDVERAIEPGTPTVQDGWPENTALRMHVTFGNVDAAFADAAHVFEDRFYSHRHTGVPMEGRGMLAVPDAGGGLTIWTSHQLPHFQRALVCQALGLPEFSVRAAQGDIGGGFGPKAGLYPEDILIPFAAHRLRRPVKWVEDRREHFISSSHSREQLYQAAVAVDDDGRILGLRYRVLLDAGAYLTFPVVLPYLGLCHLLGPYRIPALDADLRSVLTNKVTSAPYRGAGRPETVFVLNRLIDRVARELGVDRAEIRRRNLIASEEMPYSPGILYRDGKPAVFDSGDYQAALARCLETIGYEQFREEQEAARARGEYLGIGLACNVEATGIGPFEGARALVDPTGQVAVYTGVVSTGQGHETVFAQVCADVMGVTPDQVTVRTGDTATIGFSRGTYHSRAAVTAGNAVHGASVKLREKVLEFAAHQLEAATEDLEIREGMVQVKGSPQAQISLARCAQLCIPGGDLPPGMQPGLDETEYVEFPAATWAYAVHAAIVSVDPETGGVRIKRYVVVHDCGRVLNERVLDGQIHGGVAAGIGGAMLEQLVYDEDGQLLTTSFMDYLLPVFEDVPKLEVVHLETPSPLNPLGVKGAGEGGTVAPPSTLASAIEDALEPFGVSITRTPLSPSAILEAISRAQAGRAVSVRA
jgi:carbon-monoxide dehydrogenase large subunit